MTDIDTTIREAQELLAEWRKTMDADVLRAWSIDAQQSLTALLAVIEQQQVTVERQAETLRQVREAAQALVEMFREVENSPNRLYHAPTHHAMDNLARILAAGGEG